MVAPASLVGCTEVPHEGIMELLLGGVLRNCVIGESLQLHRLHLTKVESLQVSERVAVVAVALALADVASSQLVSLHLFAKRASIMTARGKCVWPTMYCSAPLGQTSTVNSLHTDMAVRPLAQYGQPH